MAYKEWADDGRDEYCFDDSDFMPRTFSWVCCNMILPMAFNFCPICGEMRGVVEK